jgi:hypothetical protein
MYENAMSFTADVVSRFPITTEQSRREADSRSPSQEILPLLWKPKVHYRVRKRFPLDFFLSQMSLVHILKLCFFKIRFSQSLFQPVSLILIFKSLPLFFTELYGVPV